MKQKIAIQGYKASFHEVAAQKFFGEEIEIVECLTFPALFDAMNEEKADLGVMAIENSVAGSILPNYARLRDSDLEVVGEVYIRVEMNLMALPGETVESLKEVHSHPIALLQSARFFRSYPHIVIVESNDTALSAKNISENQVKGWGALASKQAAELYGLNILKAGVETNKRNFTRFLVLKRKADCKSMVFISKASWSFRTAHESGSLANALRVLGEHNINMTKIQSLPVLGEEWKYYFYADLEFEDQAKYESAKEKIQPYLYDLKILGEYKKGEKYL